MKFFGVFVLVLAIIAVAFAVPDRGHGGYRGHGGHGGHGGRGGHGGHGGHGGRGGHGGHGGCRYNCGGGHHG